MRSTETFQEHHRKILADIDDEILDKSYGCGSPIPPALDGRTVLDLGCGTGRDVYLASKLVGPDGFVIGVDMTEEQLEVARRHQKFQSKKIRFQEVERRFPPGLYRRLGFPRHQGQFRRCGHLQLCHQPLSEQGTCLFRNLPRP
jgi:SAM-dependent methyltransferase